MIAAAVFHSRGLTELGDLEEVYVGLGTYLGDHADTAFGIALLARGLSSSSVGTLAGQVVMQGFIRRQIPLFLRRRADDGAGLIVLALGVNAVLARSCCQPGRALVRHPVRADPAAALLPEPRADGRARQPPHHHRRRDRRRQP